VQRHGPTTTILPSNATGLEPDAQLRILPECGGKSRLAEDEYIHGVPELIAEVAYTSARRDLGPKFQAFEADAVPEYLVLRTDIDTVTWFELKRKRYVPKELHPDGTLRSKVFPGLWLDPDALIAGDLARVLEVLKQGLASNEHAAFVTKLQAAAKRKKKS
jgi:Uma2 family endonuclease